MEKIRARHHGKKNIYVHNDLSNAVHSFQRRIETRIANNDRDGIAFDYMACLILLAFAFEAKINFLGHKLIGGWQERQAFDEKVKAVLAQLGVQPDWSARPL